MELKNVKNVVQETLVENLPELKKKVRHVLGDSSMVDDVTQECCIKIIQSENVWSGDESKLVGWMNAITRNTTIDVLNKKIRDRKTVEEFKVNTKFEESLEEAVSEENHLSIFQNQWKWAKNTM